MAGEDEPASDLAAMITSLTEGEVGPGDHLPHWRAAEGSAAAELLSSTQLQHLGCICRMFGGFLAVVSTLSRCTPGEVADIVTFGTIRVALVPDSLETP